MREEEQLKRIAELEQEVSDLKFQNSELIKALAGDITPPPEDEFADDPEFQEMMRIMDSAENEDMLLNLYRSYLLCGFQEHQWESLDFNFTVGRIMLHIPVLNDNHDTIALSTDQNYTEAADYLRDVHCYHSSFYLDSGSYTKISEWAYNLSEDEIFPKHCYEDPTYMEKFKFLKEQAKMKTPSKVFCVSYADLWLWCHENPDASIWAFRFNGLREDDTPEFYYSEEGSKNMIRLVQQTEIPDPATLEESGYIGKAVINPIENPNLDVFIYIGEMNNAESGK